MCHFWDRLVWILTCDIGNRLVTDDNFRVNLDEGVISKNLVDTGANINLIRDKLHQEYLVLIGDGS